MYAFFLAILSGIVMLVLLGVSLAYFLPQPGDGSDNRAD